MTALTKTLKNAAEEWPPLVPCRRQYQCLSCDKCINVPFRGVPADACMACLFGIPNHCVPNPGENYRKTRRNPRRRVWVLAAKEQT